MIPKFRAWDTHEDVMNRVNYIDFTNGVVGLSNENVNDYEQPIHRVKFMQSTGLKDTNGVEIFEGDILKHIDFESNECAVNVVYMKHGSLVFDVKIDSDVYTVPVYSIHPEASRGYEDILEVIGNIYENPELMEVTE